MFFKRAQQADTAPNKTAGSSWKWLPTKEDWKNWVNLPVYSNGTLPVFEVEKTASGSVYTLVDLKARLQEKQEQDSLFYRGFLRKLTTTCNIACLTAAAYIAAAPFVFSDYTGSWTSYFKDYMNVVSRASYKGLKLTGGNPDIRKVVPVGPKEDEAPSNALRLKRKIIRATALHKQGIIIRPDFDDAPVRKKASSYWVDKKGRLVDREGRLIDEQGRLIQEPDKEK